MGRLYEITALVKYAVVVYAENERAALKYVEGWEHAWDANSELIGVTDTELLAVRDGDCEDAHVVVS